MKQTLLIILGSLSFLNSQAQVKQKSDISVSNDKHSDTEENETFYSETPKAEENMSNKLFFDFKVNDIEGKSVNLEQYKGKKILVVNTASECGLTPQYKELQALYDSLGGDDFTIIGFPANNFGAQEPGDNSEIAVFCQKNYGVTFPMMSKISVKGSDIHPIYQWISIQENEKFETTGFEPAWNFHKIMIDENGNYVGQISPQTSPLDTSIIDWINS